MRFSRNRKATDFEYSFGERNEKISITAKKQQELVVAINDIEGFCCLIGGVRANGHNPEDDSMFTR
jgi:hypothetical protein